MSKFEKGKYKREEVSPKTKKLLKDKKRVGSNVSSKRALEKTAKALLEVQMENARNGRQDPEVQERLMQTNKELKEREEKQKT